MPQSRGRASRHDRTHPPGGCRSSVEHSEAKGNVSWLPEGGGEWVENVVAWSLGSRPDLGFISVKYKRDADLDCRPTTMRLVSK